MRLGVLLTKVLPWSADTEARKGASQAYSAGAPGQLMHLE